MLRLSNNVSAVFSKSAKNTLLNPVGSVGTRRIRQAPFLRGVPGYRVSSGPGTAPGEYQQQFIKRIQVNLTNTFNDALYNVSGTIIWFVASTNITDQILIRIGDINADQLPWGPGNGIEGIPFNKVYISVGVAVAGATATLAYFTDTPQSPARFF